MGEPGPVEVFHRSTLHGDPPLRRDRLVRFEPLDPANRPAPFKRYAGLEARLLPRELVRSSLPAVDVLSGGAGDRARFDRELLGTILFLSAGVSRIRGTRPTRAWHRTAMSAGNLHPIEIYVLHQGLWHYQPLEHALVPLRPVSELEGASANAGATLILTGIPWRTCWKYRERGWRHLFWDAGTTIANTLAVAAAHGIPARLEYGFDDEAVAQLAGLDVGEELPVALVRLGDDEQPIPPAGSLEPLLLASTAVAPHPLRFPLLEDAHSAGNLQISEVAQWRAAASTWQRPVGKPVASRPAIPDGTAIEDVVLRRGSTRAFKEEAGSTELLEWSLAASSAAVPSDLAPEGTLLEHYVSVHEIANRPPGRAVWRGPDGLEWLANSATAGEERAAATRLCLKQPLGGSSAFTAFHSADLESLFGDPAGARAYRAAQLESGVVAGRLALCAFALGAGATGLTFFDKEVSKHFGTAAAPMLATAVGAPVAPPVKGGAPGNPIVLAVRGQTIMRPSRPSVDGST